MPAPDSTTIGNQHQVRALVNRLQGKLSIYPPPCGSVVELDDPRALSDAERRELLRHLRDFNFVIYQSRKNPPDKIGLRELGVQLGIVDPDRNFCADDSHISSLEVSESGVRPRYIPYTDRPLGWHTDGYYYGSRSGRTIRSFILHCVRPAPDGGESALLDPDVVLLLLNELDRELPLILAGPSTFSIPPDDGQPRGEEKDRTGPVFSLDPASGSLHMRYTARRHNIRWNPDPDVGMAADRLREVIAGAADYTVRHKLESGQGVICNNVLHARTGFVDGDTAERRRLLYRARYHRRIPDTSANRPHGGLQSW